MLSQFSTIRIKGKVDVIYIDPPTTLVQVTGNITSDYVDINDTFRHSKWISFMRNGLAICDNFLLRRCNDNRN
jgi:adenine-specific DNA-methyltransferase